MPAAPQVRNGDKGAVAEGLRQVFRTGDRNYTVEQAWEEWRRIQSMIYTTNWIERLQKDFRRVTRMRGAMPDEESVLLLMARRPWTSPPTGGRCQG